MKKLQFKNNKNVIGNQLRLARIKAKLNQAQLAAKLQTYDINLDQQMISKIEHNHRLVTDYELGFFCHILKVTPQELYKDFSETYLKEE